MTSRTHGSERGVRATQEWATGPYSTTGETTEKPQSKEACANSSNSAHEM
ncbi:hypothetical protein [Ktedonosporobacter rubrisoli]|nr:hypothetical protein [Ktedonosporobacter rubrisoli]